MTNPQQPAIEATTLAVIRGELPISALQQIGIEIKSKNESYELSSTNLDLMVAPTAFDIAVGLLRYGRSTLDREDLRKWAFFLLAESGAIDLCKVETHPQGELLISALWDASFDEGPSSEVIAVVEKIKPDSQ